MSREYVTYASPLPHQVRHIPNKYTQAMLLDAIARHHVGKFDLLYLPVDFRHRCNVGYAFIEP